MNQEIPVTILQAIFISLASLGDFMCILETVQTLFLGAPKSLQMVAAAMKLKDACSLEGKL